MSNQSDLNSAANGETSDTTGSNDAEPTSIEEKQRERFEEEIGEEPGTADTRDLEPGVNDGEGLEIANMSDFFIRRSGEGENDIEPVRQKIPGRDQALRVRPFTSGMYEKYLNPVDTDDDEKLAEMFNKAFPDIKEDLGRELTAEDVENGMIAYGPEVLIDVIERAAGKDMREAIQNRNIKLLNEVDAGKMQQLMQTMGSSSDDSSVSLSSASR